MKSLIFKNRRYKCKANVKALLYLASASSVKVTGFRRFYPKIVEQY